MQEFASASVLQGPALAPAAPPSASEPAAAPAPAAESDDMTEAEIDAVVGKMVQGAFAQISMDEEA